MLALLRREEGATIAQICAATGWQGHTVRGFLAALKNKGIAVTVLERVRQVGPGKEGARGSYSVHRADAAPTNSGPARVAERGFFRRFARKAPDMHCGCPRFVCRFLSGLHGATAVAASRRSATSRRPKLSPGTTSNSSQQRRPPDSKKTATGKTGTVQ